MTIHHPGATTAPRVRPRVKPDAVLEPSARVRVAGPFLWRGERKFTVKAATYGTFAPDARGDLYPSRDVVRADFAAMRDAGINTVRTYTAPPPWLLGEARAAGLMVLVGIFYESRNCNLEQAGALEEARSAVRDALRRCAGHRDVVLAYVIGNELPALVARFHGLRVVEGFLRNLRDLVKSEDPLALVTYGNFPPTEFLRIDFLDFHTFNVYLLEPRKLSAYLDRLMILAQGKPLLLGEIGDDSIRRGHEHQAALLDWTVPLVLDKGAAGICVFAWTDQWAVGGHPVEDWAFGLVDAERRPKPALAAVARRFREAPLQRRQSAWPRVSVVVCNYNGGSTLDETLRSLLAIDYPDYEVIYVDDGSTDDSLEVARRYGDRIEIIAQPNLGLSVARNVGARAATGAIVAYTDSDAYVDADWLRFLVLSLTSGDYAAAGGPNLTPASDGLDAQCIAACPGNPTYVLRHNVDADHVAGVNMAFKRDVLLAMSGFDPVHRQAGDDVDVCWRLQDAGARIAFSPAAIVWHHRRPSIRRYLKQQYGYGAAENQLERKHRERFNLLGGIRWEGRVYQAPKRVTKLLRPFVYHGPFGTAMFQSLYQHEPSFWFLGPTTVHWYGIWALLLLLSPLSPWLGVAGAVLLGMSVWVAVVEGVTTALPLETTRRQTLRKVWIISLLHFLHPVVRWWGRTRPRLTNPRGRAAVSLGARVAELPLLFQRGKQVRSYWGVGSEGRPQAIEAVRRALKEQGFRASFGVEWDNFDVRLDGSLLTDGRIYSAAVFYDRALTWGYRNRTPRKAILFLLATSVLVVGLALEWWWLWAVVALPAWLFWSMLTARARLRSAAWATIDRVMAERQAVRFDGSGKEKPAASAAPGGAACG